MYDKTITLFNHHGGKWYPSIIDGVNIVAVSAENATTLAGHTNGDTVEIIIHCSPEKTVMTSVGEKSYLRPKEYAASASPGTHVTFNPEKDFIYDGVWSSTSPISDSGYDSGLYHALNDEYDGVYLITSVTHFGLLPHFEIGGR